VPCLDLCYTEDSAAQVDLNLVMTGSGGFVELQGTVGSAPAIDRKKGFEEIIKADPKFKIIRSQTGDFTRAKGKEVMEAFLKAEGKKINVLYDTEIAEVLGANEPKGVTGVHLRNTVTGSLHEQPVHGLFIAIGHSPATQLFHGQLDMDDSGYIKTAPDSTHTSVAGVFAAGDVKDKIFRQAVTAAGMGCMAALEAERFLAAGHSGDLPLSAA